MKAYERAEEIKKGLSNRVSAADTLCNCGLAFRKKGQFEDGIPFLHLWLFDMFLFLFFPSNYGLSGGP